MQAGDGGRGSFKMWPSSSNPYKARAQDHFESRLSAESVQIPTPGGFAQHPWCERVVVAAKPPRSLGKDRWRGPGVIIGFEAALLMCLLSVILRCGSRGCGDGCHGRHRCCACGGGRDGHDGDSCLSVVVVVVVV